MSNLILSGQDEHFRLKARYDSSVGYYRIGNRLLHRIISGAVKGQIVDHINRNKTDCRRENLRFVTKSENNRNRDVINNLGRGIYFDKFGNRYRACISINNRTIKLGSFKTVEEAKKAYEEKLKTL